MLRPTCAVLLRRRAIPWRPFATTPDLTLAADRDGIRTVTMNNPAKYNGWTDPMLRSWMGRFADAAADDSVKAVILTGSGKYYSEGGVPVLRPLIANLLATEEYAELEVEEHDEGSLAIRGGRIGAWARARRRAMS